MSSLGRFSDLFARRVGAIPSDYQHRACTQNLFPAASA
jgi:hypothetical protein